MNVHVDWSAHYKAVSRRLALATMPARIRLASVRYDAPVGPEMQAEEKPRRVPVIVSTRRDWLDVSGATKLIYVPPVKPIARRVRISEIIQIVANAYYVPALDIISDRRTATIVRPRQEAMWLCKKFTLLSLPAIGREFGGRDHTTVLHAVRKIEALVSAGEFEPLALPLVTDLQVRLKAAATTTDTDEA
jgi:hypothetical protein